MLKKNLQWSPVSCTMNKVLIHIWFSNILSYYCMCTNKRTGESVTEVNVWCNQWVCETGRPALRWVWVCLNWTRCASVLMRNSCHESWGWAHEHMCPQQELLTFLNLHSLFEEPSTEAKCIAQTQDSLHSIGNMKFAWDLLNLKSCQSVSERLQLCNEIPYIT